MAGGTRSLPLALNLGLTSHETPAEVGGADGHTDTEREERHWDGTPGLARRASPRAHLWKVHWLLCCNCQLLLFLRFFSLKMGSIPFKLEFQLVFIVTLIRGSNLCCFFFYFCHLYDQN